MALIKRICPAIGSASSSQLVLDLEKCQYLGPDGAAIIAAIVLDKRREGHIVRINAPNGPPPLRAFFRNSRLEALANEEALGQMDPTQDDKPVLPLRQFESARFQDADPIIKMLHQYGAPESDFSEYLRTCVNEITQNIQDHAESSVGDLMTARFIRPEVRVAIVDGGVGIFTTLARHWPDMTRDNVLPRVLLEEGYSARSRENNLGLGLNNLATIIRRMNGELFLLSGTSAAELMRNGKNWFGRLPTEFRGTGVFFTLPVGV